MTQVEVISLVTDAVLWAATGNFDAVGQPEIGTATAIKCRKLPSKHRSQTPNQAPVAAPVQLTVDQEIAVGSRIWFGALTNLPENPSPVYEVTDYNEIPDIKGRRAYRVVTLLKI